MRKTVLITGSSSGIGKETTIFFAKNGWNVAATMRTPEKEKELTKLPHVICPLLDVTKIDTISHAFKKTLNVFGQIDVVVNNAGFGLAGPFEMATSAQVEREIQTNVIGVMNVTREILPYFRKQRSGTIVNVASMGGRITFPLYSVYHASKWAVEGFSESLQHELKGFNIKIKIIEPGIIRTDFYGSSMTLSQNTEERAYDSIVDRAMPNMLETGRKGTDPKEIARLIYKAATDKSWKLRYQGGKNARLLLTLRKILPDGVFNRLIRKSVTG